METLDKSGSKLIAYMDSLIKYKNRDKFRFRFFIVTTCLLIFQCVCCCVILIEHSSLANNALYSYCYYRTPHEQAATTLMLGGRAARNVLVSLQSIAIGALGVHSIRIGRGFRNRVRYSFFVSWIWMLIEVAFSWPVFTIVVVGKPWKCPDAVWTSGAFLVQLSLALAIYICAFVVWKGREPKIAKAASRQSNRRVQFATKSQKQSNEPLSIVSIGNAADPKSFKPTGHNRPSSYHSFRFNASNVKEALSKVLGSGDLFSIDEPIYQDPDEESDNYNISQVNELQLIKCSTQDRLQACDTFASLPSHATSCA